MRLLLVFVEIPPLVILERLGGCEGLQSQEGLSRLSRAYALKPSTFFEAAEMMQLRRSSLYQLQLLRHL